MWLKSAKNDILKLKEQPMNELTQINDVLTHLKEHGSITSMEAITQYGCTRLSASIYKLRKKGYVIKNVLETGKTRHGRRTTWARYVLMGEEK